MVTLNYQQVRNEYMSVMNEHIELKTNSTKAEHAMVIDLLGLAAVNGCSLNTACNSVQDAPTSPAILYQLRQGWVADLDLQEIETQLNALLVERLPDYIQGGQHEVAIDLTNVPYHGEAYQDEDEIRRSMAKSGTTHFHTYASAYIVKKNKRVTVAITYCWAHDSYSNILQRLLARLDELDIDLKRLLVDREFYSTPVIRFLNQQDWQSIMAIPARGETLKTLKNEAPHSHRRLYTVSSQKHGQETFTLHVVCRYSKGRRGRHGIDRFLFAVLGHPWTGTPGQLAEKYRRRFGVETSYRLMNKLRVRTTTRNPKLRLLFFILAFTLLNLWIYLQWAVLAVPRRGGRWLDRRLFRLARFIDFLRDAIREVRKPVREVSRSVCVF
jgi:putative transposase